MLKQSKQKRTKMTVRRRSIIRRKILLRKLQDTKFLTEDISFLSGGKLPQHENELIEELLELIQRFCAHQSTDRLTTKIEEAKDLISTGKTEEALRILDDAKKETESLRMIGAQTQSVIERQTKSLQERKNRDKRCNDAMASSQSPNCQRSKANSCRYTKQTTSIPGNHGIQNTGNDVPLKNDTSAGNIDGIHMLSTRPRKVAKRDQTKRTMTDIQRGSRNRMATSSVSEGIANDEDTPMSFDRDQGNGPNIPDYSRTENNQPVATDEVSHLIQRTRNAVERVKSKFRNFERDKKLLLQNSRDEKNRLEREITIAWQRRFMETFGALNHLVLHENDQLQYDFDEIRSFGTIQEYNSKRKW